MTVYGYVRISTKKQSIERQIRNILSVEPEAKIYQEAFTGTTTDRKEWNKLLKVLKANDTIIFDSVSRMSRNAEEGFAAYEKLYSDGINLVFLKEPHINTEVYKQSTNKQINIHLLTGDAVTDRFINTIITALNDYTIDLAKEQIRLAFEQSEKEVQDLRQRTREGIETARQHGKQIGHKEGTKLITKKSITAKADILKHNKDFGGSLNDIDTMRLTGLSRNTFYKYKRELKEDQNVAC